MSDIVERLMSYDVRDPMRDEAADEITALRARLEAVEKERDDYRRLMGLERQIADKNAQRAERVEAALATARRDALEEAAAEAAGEVAAHGHAEIAPFLRRRLSALIDKDATP